MCSLEPSTLEFLGGFHFTINVKKLHFNYYKHETYIDTNVHVTSEKL